MGHKNQNKMKEPIGVYVYTRNGKEMCTPRPKLADRRADENTEVYFEDNEGNRTLVKYEED